MYQENKGLGMRIEAHRKNKKYSQEELAQAIQMESTLIEQMEKGEITHLAEFVKLCNVLELPFEKIACESKSSDIDQEIRTLLGEFSDRDKETLVVIMYRILELCKEEEMNSQNF